MVLLWLLKIMYAIALHGFVIESNLFFFWFNNVKNLPKSHRILPF